jgi:hypothetical protein
VTICQWGEADVYIYKDVRGGFACCGCSLRGRSPSVDEMDSSADATTFFVDTAEEILLHMHEHKDAGDRIPKKAMDAVVAIIKKES